MFLAGFGLFLVFSAQPQPAASSNDNGWKDRLLVEKHERPMKELDGEAIDVDGEEPAAAEEEEDPATPEAALDVNEELPFGFGGDFDDA